MSTRMKAMLGAAGLLREGYDQVMANPPFHEGSATDFAFPSLLW